MKLATYLNRNPGAASRLARALSVTTVSVSEWKRGLKYPSFENAVAIDAETGGVVTAEEMRPDLAWAIRYLRQRPARR